MTYSIKYVKGNDLNKIQDEWKALETGEEMTLFQSYQWHLVLLEQYIPTDTANFESIYAIVETDSHPCMIAPLWIVKKSFRLLNQKGVYLLGRSSFSDYLNFVYQHFDGSASLYGNLYDGRTQRQGTKGTRGEQSREHAALFRRNHG